jgi:hypothetical protein
VAILSLGTIEHINNYEISLVIIKEQNNIIFKKIRDIISRTLGDNNYKYIKKSLHKNKVIIEFSGFDIFSFFFV